MTRLEHFIRGNGLSLSDVAEWSTMKQEDVQALLDGTVEPRMFDVYRLVGACSYLLGRRVRIAELLDLGE
jgi:hypothetical protein